MPDIVVARLDSIPPEGGRTVSVAGLDLAVFRVGDEVHVLENRCAHLDSPLADGFLRAGCVTCASHGWTYDLATGARVGLEDGAPRVAVQRYEAWVTEEHVVIRIEGE